MSTYGIAESMTLDNMKQDVSRPYGGFYRDTTSPPHGVITSIV